MEELTKTIVIKNPSPKLRKFLKCWANKQKEVLKKAKEKYANRS